MASHESTLSADNDDDFLFCGICSELYTNPKLLACLHSFCEQCLSKLVEKTGALTCPTCRRPAQVPASGVAGLRGNEFIDELVKKEKKIVTESVKCEACKLGDVTDRCLDCAVSLCATCSAAHKFIPATRTHRLLAIDEYHKTRSEDPASVQPPVYCSRHLNHPETFYCDTCEIPICLECTVLDHPRPVHKYRYLKEAASEFVRHLSEVTQDLKGRESDAVDSKVNIQRRIESLNDHYQVSKTKLGDHVDKTVEDMTNRIREDGAHLARLLDEEYEDRRVNLRAQLKGVECMEDDLAHARDFTERLVRHGNDSYLMSARNEIISQTEDLRTTDTRCEPTKDDYLQFLPSGEFCETKTVGKLQMVRPRVENGDDASHHAGLQLDIEVVDIYGGGEIVGGEKDVDVDNVCEVPVAGPGEDISVEVAYATTTDSQHAVKQSDQVPAGDDNIAQKMADGSETWGVDVGGAAMATGGSDTTNELGEAEASNVGTITTEAEAQHGETSGDCISATGEGAAILASSDQRHSGYVAAKFSRDDDILSDSDVFKIAPEEPSTVTGNIESASSECTNSSSTVDTVSTSSQEIPYEEMVESGDPEGDDFVAFVCAQTADKRQPEQERSPATRPKEPSAGYQTIKHTKQKGLIRKFGGSGSSAGQLKGPWGVASLRGGDVVVGDTGNNRLQTFTVNGESKKIIEFPDFDTCFKPEFSAVSEDGHIFTTDAGNKQVVVCDENGELVRCFGKGKFKHPRGIAISPTNGNVYVADTNADSVLVYRQDGEFVKAFGKWEKEDARLATPWCVAVGSTNGNVYVSNCGNHAVKVYSEGGEHLLSFGSLGTDKGQFYHPEGLATDKYDCVYVCDCWNNRVQKFDMYGSWVCRVDRSKDQVKAPVGICVKSDADDERYTYVFVVEQASGVVKVLRRKLGPV